MPKRRVPPTPRNNKKKNKKVPETANEFLDVGVEHEESGDRWRPGDKLKAGRFYQRAIECYGAALQRMPDSFDAAYNLARLQYQLAQHPELLGSTYQSSRLLLNTALASHRRCLALNPTNEDALFNTGQVLCSFSEALIEYRTAPIEAKTEAAQLLVEAVSILQKCLSVQEAQYAALQNLGSQQGVDVPMGEEETAQEAIPEQVEDGMDQDSEPPEQWAVIQTPTTPDHLLDTSLAALQALTTLLPLSAEGLGQPLAQAQAAAQTLLETAIPPLSQATGRQHEVALATANLRVALAEAAFKTGGSVAAWEAEIRAAFDGWEAASFQAVCDKADAHIQLAATTGDEAMAWKHYAFAAQSLSAAAKLEPLKAEINIARGDIELLRSRLGVPSAVQSRALLVKNAGVYYRGAKRLEGSDERVKGEAAVKEAMVNFEMGDQDALKGIAVNETVRDVIVEAVDEGIFGMEWLNHVGGRAAVAPPPTLPTD